MTVMMETYLLNLVSIEVRNAVDYDPRQRTPKVHGLVHYKGHDARGQDIVAHPSVPCQPHLLEVVELNVVLGYLLKGCPIRILRHWRQDGG